jgi:general secretion pathway protein D
MKLGVCRWIVVGLLVAMATGCADMPIFGDSTLRDARRLIDQEQSERGLLLLEKAARDKPQVYVYRTEYFRQRDLLVVRWIAQAEALLTSGQYELAAEPYRRVLKYDSGNARAGAGLARIEAENRHRALIAAVGKLVTQDNYREAEDVLRPVLAENPQNRDARRLQRLIEEKTVKPAIVTPRLTPAALKPLTLEMQDVPLRAIFDVISRAVGVNFIFDKDVRTDQRTGLAIQDAPAEEVIRLILSTNQLEQKIVNERTIVIFPNTNQKLREYQELVVKSFYLANADVKQTANMVSTLVKTRDIFVDEKLNLLIIKDTPGAVRMAERLIAAQDLAEAEVMLEVEVLEVAVNKLIELGIRWPTSVDVSVAGGGTTTTAGTPGRLTLSEVRNFNSGLVSLTVTDPLFQFRLLQSDGSTSVLANPRIRVKNKGKARIHIGDRVPVITTTAAAVGGFVSESVTYLDVGLKLEVEPLIHLEDEVAITVGLEVSNIARELRSAVSNTLTYQIGTRNATTSLRLRDGETQVLAGLISDEDRRTANRVPGIGEFPVVRRLFSSTRDSTAKTEIVLLITPRLVRTLTRPDARSLEFAAGTEASSGAGSGGAVPGLMLSPAFVPGAPSPVQPGPSPAPGMTGPTPGAATPQPPFPNTPVGPEPTPALSAPALPPGTMVPFGGVQPSPR